MADRAKTTFPTRPQGRRSSAMNTQIETAKKFVAPVVYVQPDFEELARRFSARVDHDYVHVHPNYKGKRFDPIERCKDVSKESREIVFEYIQMDYYAATDDVLVEMDRKGLRPAL